MPNAVELYEKTGANVVMMEYRGFGKSTGWPCQAGHEIDARTTIDWLSKHSDFGVTPLVLFGRSLGGAVALHAAADPKSQPHIRAVLVENTFTSVLDMIDAVAPIFTYVKPLVRNPWKSSDIVANIQVPLGVISGELDELIPITQHRAIYDTAKKAGVESRFLSIPEGRHNDTWTRRGYWDLVVEWFSQLDLSR